MEHFLEHPIALLQLGNLLFAAGSDGPGLLELTLALLQRCPERRVLPSQRPQLAVSDGLIGLELVKLRLQRLDVELKLLLHLLNSWSSGSTPPANLDLGTQVRLVLLDLLLQLDVGRLARRRRASRVAIRNASLTPALHFPHQHREYLPHDRHQLRQILIVCQNPLDGSKILLALNELVKLHQHLPLHPILLYLLQ
jgi:hypothetical protein